MNCGRFLLDGRRRRRHQQKFQTALDLTLRKRTFSKRRAQAPKRAAQVTAVISTPQRAHNTFNKQSCQAQDIGKLNPSIGVINFEYMR